MRTNKPVLLYTKDSLKNCTPSCLRAVGSLSGSLAEKPEAENTSQKNGEDYILSFCCSTLENAKKFLKQKGTCQ